MLTPEQRSLVEVIYKLLNLHHHARTGRAESHAAGLRAIHKGRRATEAGVPAELLVWIGNAARDQIAFDDALDLWQARQHADAAAPQGGRKRSRKPAEPRRTRRPAQPAPRPEAATPQAKASKAPPPPQNERPKRSTARSASTPRRGAPVGADPRTVWPCVMYLRRDVDERLAQELAQRAQVTLWSADAGGGAGVGGTAEQVAEFNRLYQDAVAARGRES